MECLKERSVLKRDNVQEHLSVHTESFYLSLNVPQLQISWSSALRGREERERGGTCLDNT